MKKIFKSRLVCYFLGILTMLCVGSVFAYSYIAEEIGFTPTSGDWDVDNVQEALDNFRDIAGTCIFTCPYAPGSIVYESGTSGTSVKFVPLCDGTYQFEVWGASGGYGYSSTYRGGYGAYARGLATLQANDPIYIAIGGEGKNGTSKTADYAGGYNGGGNSYHWGNNNTYSASGGGATHIAKAPGQLKLLSDYKGTYNSTYYSSDMVYIVAAGGGGGYYFTTTENAIGGSGGGISGVNGNVNPSAQYRRGLGGTQTAGGSFDGTGRKEANAGGFGYGGDSSATVSGSGGGSGGGAGFFGGGGSSVAGAGGGSSYIASSLLIPNDSNQIRNVMYCYSCSESSNLYTYTVSTYGSTTHEGERNSECSSGYSTSPLSGCAKKGNGYAIIKYIGE